MPSIARRATLFSGMTRVWRSCKWNPRVSARSAGARGRGGRPRRRTAQSSCPQKCRKKTQKKAPTSHQRSEHLTSLMLVVSPPSPDSSCVMSRGPSEERRWCNRDLSLYTVWTLVTTTRIRLRRVARLDNRYRSHSPCPAVVCPLNFESGLQQLQRVFKHIFDGISRAQRATSFA